MKDSLYKEESRHNKHERRHYRSKFRVTLTILLALVATMFIYFTWLSYQPPAWQQFCEKSTFPDGTGTLWKCPREVK